MIPMGTADPFSTSIVLKALSRGLAMISSLSSISVSHFYPSIVVVVVVDERRYGER